METSPDTTVTKPVSEEYTQFLSGIQALEKPEEKLKYTLDFMRSSLSKDSTPAFKDFWDAKNLCLEFFKEKIPPRVRTPLWKDYVELSNAIRKLKEVLDEQSKFAQEQISLAIEAMEQDLAHLEEKLSEGGMIEIPTESKILQDHAGEYIEKQKEVDLLNAFAGRLNGLRKELIQTQMRIRTKNQLFDRLSLLGNGIFPRRKELIKALSELFSSDVEQFIATQFHLDGGPYFALKEEIKTFQNIAKVLTIDTATFRKTREVLSSCWDQIKEQEKVFKDKKSAERVAFSQNYDILLPRAREIKSDCEEGNCTLEEADSRISAFLEEMKSIELAHADVKSLKKMVLEAKKPLEEKAAETRAKKKQAEELEKIKARESSIALMDNLLEVIHQSEALSLDALVEKWEAFVKEEKALKIEGVEKAILGNRLGTVGDCIQEKKWQELSEESGEDSTSGLRSLLDDRHKERRKVKEALEIHRKKVGGSSLSLEESMLYQELISEEKSRLDSIETIIEEIEERLFDIEE